MNEEEQTTGSALHNEKLSVENEDINNSFSALNAGIENKQRETANENQETSNDQIKDMEVHHHTHASHGKKTWKNYFWEFLMLFLAVFCGFLAEYKLEHVIENQREKEYMVSMLSDINKDTISSNNAISENKKFIAGENTTLLFLTGNLQNRDTAETALLNFYKYCIYEHFMRKNDGTISQLKNSGGFRLLKNKEVIDKINYYYNLITVLKTQEESLDQFLNIIDKQAGEIFNYKTNKAFIDSANLCETGLYELPVARVKSWLTHESPTMLTTDIKVLSPFMSNISYHMGLMQSYIQLLKQQKKVALELILAIKTAYHLENE